MSPLPLTAESEKFIEEAAVYLENSSFMIRAANRLGEPIEALQKRLPEKLGLAVANATRLALNQALAGAISTFGTRRRRLSGKTSARIHRAMVTVTGAVGGAFGLAALPVELPLSTVLMMRLIADHAQSAGFDVKDPQIQLECLYVFSLGGPSKSDDAAETAYYTSRVGLAQLLRSGAGYIAAHSAKEILSGVEKGTAEVLVRFIGSVAARFEMNVSQKALLQAAPVVGGLGGAAINALFADHFSNAARFHFGLKRLEVEHGELEVREFYKRFALSHTRKG